MIVIDVRAAGKDLTLRDCAAAYDEVTNMAYTPAAMRTFLFKTLTTKVVCLPDQLWVTTEQHKLIFSSMAGNWEYWRGIPIRDMDIQALEDNT